MVLTSILGSNPRFLAPSRQARERSTTRHHGEVEGWSLTRISNLELTLIQD